MTLALLWEECTAVPALGYQYSWFCERYLTWSNKLGLVMRQKHRARRKYVYRLCRPDRRHGGPPDG
ncbi:hypothetical protein DFAR_1180020 [Desulfarculales bacterium]